MSDFDYRAARDRIYGVVRNGKKIGHIEPNGLTMVERMLLLVLIEFAPNVEPSVESLVKMTGMCERTVRGTLRALEQKGVIVTTSRHGRKSRYDIRLPDCDPGKTCPQPGQDVPPCDTIPPGQDVPPTPAADAPVGGQQMPPKQTTKQTRKRTTSLSAKPTPRTSSGFALEPPKPKPEAKPEHGHTLERWVQRFAEAHGEPPILSKVDLADVKRLLDGLNRDGTKACELIDNAFTDDWFKANGTIGMIANHPSKYQQRSRPMAPRKATPVQRGVDEHVATGGLEDLEPKKPALRAVPGGAK